MDWMPLVRALIGLTASAGLAALIANTIITGNDIPTGVVTVLMGTIGAVFGLEAVGKRKGGDD